MRRLEQEELDERQQERQRAGAALREWRAQEGLSQADLAKKLGVDSSLITKFERGRNAPTEEQITKLEKLGATVLWRKQDRDADAAAGRVQQLLESGAPLADVYATASRELATFLVGGLSPDRQRAWTTLLRTLRDGVAERGRIMPLHEHPEWGKVIELLLDAVSEVPGGVQAVLQAASRISGQTNAERAA